METSDSTNAFGVPGVRSNKRLAPVAIAFAEAERRLKQSELLTGEVCIPSINELRYACCHILRDECPEIPQEDAARESQHHSDGGNGIGRDIERAIDHCKRAKYDAIAIDVAAVKKWLEVFKEDYRLILDETIPGLEEGVRAADEADRMINICDANPNDRSKYAEKLDELCASLHNAERVLESKRFQLNAKRDRRIKEEEEARLKAELEREERERKAAREEEDRRVSRRRWVIGSVVFGILGLLTTIGLGIANLHVNSQKLRDSKTAVPIVSPSNR